MTKTYYPFDEGAGADVEEDQWKEFALYWRGTGVLAGELNELEPYGDSSGMQVKVKSGMAWIRGFFFKSDAEEIVAIDAADGSNPRWDLVVLEVDWTNNDIDLAVVKGTAGASPTKPSLTQSSSIWQIPLAWVYVPTSAATITQYDVFDARVYDYADILGRGRASLVKGVYVPDADVKAEAPASTDAGAETVAYGALPVWGVTGQSVQVSATGGGLSVSTEYFINVSGLNFSFHLTERDALGGANKVNLTGNIQPNTIFPARVYFVGGNAAEFSVSLIGLTASSAYEVYLDETAKLPTLATLVWTSLTARATDIELRADGKWALTSNSKYLTVATLRTTTVTGQVESSDLKRNLINLYNTVRLTLKLEDATASWPYNGALRQMRGVATNQVEFMVALASQIVEVVQSVMVSPTPANGLIQVSIGLDGVTSSPDATYNQQRVNVGGPYFTEVAKYEGKPGVGSHVLVPLEYASAGVTTWYGSGLNQLMIGGTDG